MLGANDVANAFATSVGSGALSLKSAILIAAIMEFLGAFLLGGNVASKIMKGITVADHYVECPEVLMFGMMCVLVGVAAWLILATLYGLPVSTTHSCIGGIVGMAVVSMGMSAVNWKQVGLVALSWIISPISSGLLSTLIFVLVRKFILRASNSLERSFKSYPAIIAFTFALNLFLVLYSSKSLNLNMPLMLVFVICLAIGIIIALILQFTFIPYARKTIEREKNAASAEISAKEVKVSIEMVETKTEIPIVVEVRKQSQEVAITTAESTTETTTTEITSEKKVEEDKKKTDEEIPSESNAVVTIPVEKTPSTPVAKVPVQNIHAELEDEKSKVYQMHKNAEVFDEDTERLFTYLQILTAIFNSFAHGANDVANAIGPFAMCIQLYRTGDVMAETRVEPWILVLGGIGIIVGLACLGYKVMAAIGVNMVKVTPSRGFSIEIGSALIVIIGSAMGLPLSTTHCKVGSTVGIGMAEGKNGVNWSLLYGVFAGWIVTLFVCAVSTGLIFAFAAYAPKLLHVCSYSHLWLPHFSKVFPRYDCKL